MATSYTDFTFYSTSFLGVAIAAAAFPRLALRASTVLDQLCFDRVAAIVTAATDTNTIEAIEMATCAVAEELQTQESAGSSDGITSERVGSYSVTYGAKANAAKTNSEKLFEAARFYLWNTGLMYRGFTDDEPPSTEVL